MVTDVNEMQSSKALDVICVTPTGMAIDVSEVQPLKAYFPIPVTPIGIAIDVSEVQCCNAYFPIVVTPSGMVIEVSASTAATSHQISWFMAKNFGGLMSGADQSPNISQKFSVALVALDVLPLSRSMGQNKRHINQRILCLTAFPTTYRPSAESRC